MLRVFSILSVAFLGLSQLGSAATISGTLNPGFPNSLTGRIERTVDGGTETYDEGPIGPWTPPTFTTVVNVNKALDGGIALVRTDVSLQTSGNDITYKLTSYAAMYTPGGNPITVPSGSGSSQTTSAVSYLVRNSAFWEFQLDGNYDWRIRDTDPLSRGSANRRTYDFVKVVNGVEDSIFDNSSGTGALNPVGQSEIGSGTYRLYFLHSDSDLLRLNTADVNSVDLDITFTFKSEDNGGGGGGGGVVPEPSSVAVFGLLSVGSIVAKWRRKRTQPLS